MIDILFLLLLMNTQYQPIHDNTNNKALFMIFFSKLEIELCSFWIFLLTLLLLLYQITLYILLYELRVFLLIAHIIYFIILTIISQLIRDSKM
jgi:hypothetical protein